MPFTEAEWQAWQHRLRQTVTERRYGHCERVAEEAAQLARYYGLDEQRARLAGLLHDVARDLPLAELLSRAKEYNIDIGTEELANPIILHAPVGAAILAREWNIEDATVLQAIELHTVARPGMNEFCQVLYLADLIEPGRKKWPELDRLRTLCYQSLALGMAEALEGNLRYLSACGTFVHPLAAQAYEFFRRQAMCQEKGRNETVY